MGVDQLELPVPGTETQRRLSLQEFIEDVGEFCEFGTETQVLDFPNEDFDIPVLVNEFWTSKQRAANSIHEVSYRACFKPQLPRFFIVRLTEPGEVVYDPFMGRGTTPIEAALLGRRPAGCDINPLSKILIAPRLDPPELVDVRERLQSLELRRPTEIWDDLTAFYHPATLAQITNLRRYLLDREVTGQLDAVDRWIRMVATNRLTGHSSGFFSVYTLPPNQAVSIGAQRKINERRDQVPTERDVKGVILRKSKSLLSKMRSTDLENLRASGDPILTTGSSDNALDIPDGSVSLVVTSPPFLDTVDYQSDNWLRCWFNGIDASAVDIWQLKKPQDWQSAMCRTFGDLARVLRPGGRIAFEVGEVRSGKVLLENLVVPAAAEAGLTPHLVMVNDQVFTKTSNCWGVENLKKGTNTNRIVLIGKD